MNAKQTLKTLNTVYFALFMGQMIFFGVAYYLNTENLQSTENSELFRYFVPIVIIACIGLSYFLYNLRKKQGQELEGLDTKAGHYRVSNIVRYAVVEAGNMLALVSYLMTGSSMFITLFILGMGVFVLYRPSHQRFTSDYMLDISEQDELKRV